jgi:hypothetical protein
MTARNTGARPVSARALAMHHACVRGDARRPNHTSSEDGTGTHGLVASRPIELEWQQETQGRSPFLRAQRRALTLCNMHVLRAARTRRCADARPC